MKENNSEELKQTENEQQDQNVSGIGQVEEKAPESNPVEKTEEEILEDKITELESSVNQYKDQLMRKVAEFDNYKKRIENEYANRVKFASEDLVFDLLPVIDDFERSLKSGKERKDFDTFFRGIELIYQKFVKVLNTQGVESYDVIGKQFDAHLHDALMQMPKPGVEPHTILEEVEKGYTMHGKVLRHAKVVVASEDQQESSKEKIIEIKGQDEKSEESAQ